MRVAHIVNSLTKASGISAFCAHIAYHLAEQGVEIDLYVWWVGDDALVPEHELIHVYETKDTGFNPVVKPDVVHVHSLWVPLAHQGCVYARKNGIPYILSPHGMLTSWALRHKWWKKLPGMLLFQYHDLLKAKRLHATAKNEEKDFRRLKLQQEVAIVPLGTELPLLSDEMRVVLKCPDKVRTALFLSRIHQVKGLNNLFEAWNIVKHDRFISNSKGGMINDGEHWRLVIAGPDSMGYKAELLLLAKSLGLHTMDLSGSFSLTDLNQMGPDVDIVFTGPVYGTVMDQLYRMADLFVLPSFSENFGVVVSDALAYEVPVITTRGTPWIELEGEIIPVEKQNEDRMSGTRELPREDDAIAKGRCGWFVDIGVAPLVNALIEAMQMTDEERRALGRNGRHLIERKYTWPVVANKMLEAYKEMITDQR